MYIPNNAPQHRVIEYLLFEALRAWLLHPLHSILFCFQAFEVSTESWSPSIEGDFSETGRQCKQIALSFLLWWGEENHRRWIHFNTDAVRAAGGFFVLHSFDQQLVHLSVSFRGGWNELVRVVKSGSRFLFFGLGISRVWGALSKAFV